jgi:hypothetical protein
MTPEERAEACLAFADLSKNLTYAPDDIRERIAAAIRAAVEAEREACASLADGYGELGCGSSDIAAAIRARKDPA